HETAAEDAVELVHARRDALGLLGRDVDEPQERLRRRLRPRDLADDLLDERSEGGAAGALPEPPRGGVAALRAGVLDRRLRHAFTLRMKPDEFVRTNKKRPPPQGAAFCNTRGDPSPRRIGAPFLLR